MHIAIDIRSLLSPFQTGVGQFTSGLLLALGQHTEHTYTLYYNAAKPVTIPKELRDIGTIVHTKYPNKLVTVAAGITNIPKIDRAIEKKTYNKVDLLYTPNIQFAPHSKNTPHVMTIHDLSFLHMPEHYSRRQQWWHRVHRLRHQAKRAAAIVVPSESTKADVVHTLGIVPERVHVVYPGISEGAFEPLGSTNTGGVKEKYSLRNKYIFTLGTLEPRKNYNSLIDAFVRSKLPTDGYELVIAGAPGWNNDSLMKQIANTTSVRYIGYVAEVDKPALYALADMFVYPSIFEGFGFPVLEAMAQGTTVITSNRTSLPEITLGKAVYAHPYRVSELAALLNANRGKEKNEVLRDVAKKYSWKDASATLETIFETYGK